MIAVELPGTDLALVNLIKDLVVVNIVWLHSGSDSLPGYATGLDEHFPVPGIGLVAQAIIFGTDSSIQYSDLLIVSIIFSKVAFDVETKHLGKFGFMSVQVGLGP